MSAADDAPAARNWSGIHRARGRVSDTSRACQSAVLVLAKRWIRATCPDLRYRSGDVHGPEPYKQLHDSGPGWTCQFLQPGMMPGGKQLSGVFLTIAVILSVSGLPLLAKMPPPSAAELPVTWLSRKVPGPPGSPKAFSVTRL